MKKGLLLILALTIIVSVVFADTMVPGPQKKAVEVRGKTRLVQNHNRPDEAEYTFTVNPTTLLMSFYDYMIGAYNDLPLCVQPDETYGGYFLTFHGKRTATGQRRVFYGYISDTGNIENLNEITSVQNWEGYPGIAVDPLTGKPLYAWHVNTDADAEYEVQFAYDAFFGGAAGLLSDPVVVIDNPSTVTPQGTVNNEFIWPTVKIGPSPNAGMRRVYILARNAETHTTNPSENVKIAYADFNGDMLETGVALTWNYTSIPELDNWNHDTSFSRRPNNGFEVGNDGRIYYVGSHTSYLLPDGDLVEPDLDAFVCDNYGTGTWTRVTGSSVYQSWNPKLNYGNGLGFFTLNDNITPVPDDSLFFQVSYGAHVNAAMDNQHGKIHINLVMAQNFRELESGVLNSYYHPSFQPVRNVVYDVNAETFSLVEVYPMAGTASDQAMWLAWDENGDGLVDEYYTNPDDPNDTDNGTPLLASVWPFPYWDSAVHTNAMFFHYGNTKITPPNAQGMMAAVWQEANRARLYNLYPASYPELLDYATAPEIMISVSSNYGVDWSEPIALNKVDTPQLANMKPMWVYPADQIKFTGMTTETTPRKKGKLALMFYDDISWGAYSIEGPVGQNDGGYVKFTELEITFPVGNANDSPVVTPSITMLKQNYPNPFNPKTTISFNMPKSGFANLSIYNAKGQLVKTLTNGMTKAGDNKIVWEGTDNNGSRVSSGLYFYKLSANGKTETRKMMLMK
jgi:hypothetical protein